MIPNGGTFVRPGVIAWDGLLSPGPRTAAGAGYSSSEVVEQAITAALADLSRLPDLLDELACARLWLPLPDGPRPVTDGSAIDVPVITSPSPPQERGARPAGEGCDFVPAFTSVQRLGAWSDPRAMRADPAAATGPVRSGDPAWIRDIAAGTGVVRHVVVPFPGLVSRMPPGLGIAINPGSRIGLQLWPEAVGQLAGHPASEPGR